MPRVRLWSSWPSADGRVYRPGEVVEVAADESAAILTRGAGEAVDPQTPLGFAVMPPPPERALSRRGKARHRGR